MNTPLYTLEILRLAAAVPFVARFEEVAGPELRSPTCGARMKVSVTLDSAGRVTAFSQAVEACAFGQAAAALVGAYAMGRDADGVAAALAATELWLAGAEDAEPWPGFAVLEPARHRPGRHGALLLPLRALRAAIAAGA